VPRARDGAPRPPRPTSPRGQSVTYRGHHYPAPAPARRRIPPSPPPPSLPRSLPRTVAPSLPQRGSSGHGSAPAADGGAGRRRPRRGGLRPGAAARGWVPVAEAGQRRHGRATARRPRRRNLRPPRQRPHLLRPLQPQAAHARRALARRQGRVSAPPLLTSVAPSPPCSLLHSSPSRVC